MGNWGGLKIADKINQLESLKKRPNLTTTNREKKNIEHVGPPK